MEGLISTGPNPSSFYISSERVNNVEEVAERFVLVDSPDNPTPSSMSLPQ